MSERRKPPRLRPGMTLSVVAASSPVLEGSTINRGVARLEQLGFTVVFGASARDSYSYRAGRSSPAPRTCWRCWSATTWTP
jgi:muramoyltetrapeptide carboxypeptidase LdcA involved in peptidoglycan recycling